MPLYIIFVDFIKAFDIVKREMQLNIPQKQGYPDHFVKLVSALHTGIKTPFGFKVELTEAFEVGNGVKQVCVLAPTLLDFLSMDLSDAFTDSTQGVWINN